MNAPQKVLLLKNSNKNTTLPQINIKPPCLSKFIGIAFVSKSGKTEHSLFIRQKKSAAWPGSWPGSCILWSEASLYRPIISLFRRRELWPEAGTGSDLPGIWDLLQMVFESANKIKKKFICTVLNSFYTDLFLLIKCMLVLLNKLVQQD